MLSRDSRANAWVENEIAFVNKPIVTIKGLLWSISVQIQSLCKVKWKWKRLCTHWSSMKIKKQRLSMNLMHLRSSLHLWIVQSKHRITQTKTSEIPRLLKDLWPKTSIQEGIDLIQSMILILRESKCFNRLVNLWDSTSISLYQSNSMMKRSRHYHKASALQRRNLTSLMTCKL